MHLEKTYILLTWIIKETVIIVESFGHIVRHCRNQRIVGQEKRISYQDNDRD